MNAVKAINLWAEYKRKVTVTKLGTVEQVFGNIVIHFGTEFCYTRIIATPIYQQLFKRFVPGMCALQ